MDGWTLRRLDRWGPNAWVVEVGSERLGVRAPWHLAMVT